MTKINEYIAINEAKKLISNSTQSNISLRLFGGVGIYLKCKNGIVPEILRRDYVDLDFVGLSNDIPLLTNFFIQNGYSPLRRFNAVLGSERLLFVSDGSIGHIDVIIDKLRMCHVVDLRSRLLIDEYTIPIVDLLMSKLQIVNISEKDLNDIVLLLLNFDLGKTDKDEINILYLKNLVSRNWGLWKTTIINLNYLISHVEGLCLSRDLSNSVLIKLSSLIDVIENCPKSPIWKLRSIIGTRVKWYEIPGDVIQ